MNSNAYPSRLSIQSVSYFLCFHNFNDAVIIKRPKKNGSNHVSFSYLCPNLTIKTLFS